MTPASKSSGSQPKVFHAAVQLPCRSAASSVWPARNDPSYSKSGNKGRKTKRSALLKSTAVNRRRRKTLGDTKDRQQQIRNLHAWKRFQVISDPNGLVPLFAAPNYVSLSHSKRRRQGRCEKSIQRDQSFWVKGIHAIPIVSHASSKAAHTDERLEPGPERGEGGDPGARDNAAVQMHLSQPAPGGPAGLGRAQVPHGCRVQLSKHAQILVVAELEVRLRRRMHVSRQLQNVHLHRR